MSTRHLKLIRIFGALILQAGSVLLDDSCELRDVLQKAFAGEAQEILAKLWIMKVDFQQPVIAHGQNFAILSAFDRLCPPVVGRQKAELTDETSGRNLDAEFGHQKFPCNRKEQLTG